MICNKYRCSLLSLLIMLGNFACAMETSERFFPSIMFRNETSKHIAVQIQGELPDARIDLDLPTKKIETKEPKFAVTQIKYDIDGEENTIPPSFFETYQKAQQEGRGITVTFEQYDPSNNFPKGRITARAEPQKMQQTRQQRQQVTEQREQQMAQALEERRQTITQLQQQQTQAPAMVQTKQQMLHRIYIKNTARWWGIVNIVAINPTTNEEEAINLGPQQVYIYSYTPSTLELGKEYLTIEGQLPWSGALLGQEETSKLLLISPAGLFSQATQKVGNLSDPEDLSVKLHIRSTLENTVQIRVTPTQKGFVYNDSVEKNISFIILHPIQGKTITWKYADSSEDIPLVISQQTFDTALRDNKLITITFEENALTGVGSRPQAKITVQDEQQQQTVMQAIAKIFGNIKQRLWRKPQQPATEV